ncbi:hypothetical protein EJ02DRAFT_471689 [Clathrospora elynae]|uniref:Uncharacterized protein n=1 Tax=Clathrospora elynae TaxID=706981 RepID=A0A6A5SBA4_9PLEO|nr:hypothetical protein EJ02DRAFT_471689 [Clathrospora elynae]
MCCFGRCGTLPPPPIDFERLAAGGYGPLPPPGPIGEHIGHLAHLFPVGKRGGGGFAGRDGRGRGDHGPSQGGSSRGGDRSNRRSGSKTSSNLGIPSSTSAPQSWRYCAGIIPFKLNLQSP